MTRPRRQIPTHWRWFNQARFGMFIHFGPYAAHGLGEQVLFREHLDQRQYAEQAARWNPRRFDAEAWAQCAKQAGMKYAVLTTRHHDGYCLWDSALTEYTSAAKAPKRDLVAEYVRAFRKAGLRVGLYYSLADWRIPAYWAGPGNDPEGWREFRRNVHGQVSELLSNYGRIDVIWFDGAWPHPATHWQSRALVRAIRRLQPGILINNRLGSDTGGAFGGGRSKKLGDFGTPEHHITADPDRLWESCQTSTWRLWGHTRGERWRPADVLLDMLVQSAGMGGNLLLNVGPKADGTLPAPFVKRMREIGRWMAVHGEAIYGSERGDVCEFVTRGWQTVRGNRLYLVIRFWDGRPELRMAGLKTRVREARLLTTGRKLTVRQDGDVLHLWPLPKRSPTKLFPVIKLTCSGPPEPARWARNRLWCGDPLAYLNWARAGEGTF